MGKTDKKANCCLCNDSIIVTFLSKKIGVTLLITRKLFLLFLCFFLSILSFIGCSRNDEAIELVKKAKVVGSTKTNEEEVQIQIEEGAKKNVKYKWTAKENERYGTYVVSFVDTKDERGFFWECDFKTKTVKKITGNWLLEKRYGITPLMLDYQFTLENVTSESVSLSKDYFNDGIVYRINGEIKNNTNKTISKAKFFGILVVIYTEQKIIEKREKYYNTKLDIINTYKPWKPGESRKFYLETQAIDSIYKDYVPLDAFCFLFLNLEDPLGYEYSGAFEERDLAEQFKHLVAK